MRLKTNHFQILGPTCIIYIDEMFKESLRAPRQNSPYKNQHTEQHKPHVKHQDATDFLKKQTKNINRGREFLLQKFFHACFRKCLCCL